MIHQKNSGAATARNNGIKHANGEYMGFVDADDMIRVNMIESVYQSAKKNDCDIAITSAYTVTDIDYVKCKRGCAKKAVSIRRALSL